MNFAGKVVHYDLFNVVIIIFEWVLRIISVKIRLLTMYLFFISQLNEVCVRITAYRYHRQLTYGKCIILF